MTRTHVGQHRPRHAYMTRTNHRIVHLVPTQLSMGVIGIPMHFIWAHPHARCVSARRGAVRPGRHGLTAVSCVVFHHLERLSVRGRQPHQLGQVLDQLAHGRAGRVLQPGLLAGPAGVQFVGRVRVLGCTLTTRAAPRAADSGTAHSRSGRADQLGRCICQNEVVQRHNQRVLMRNFHGEPARWAGF
jgi:hypothetical protein